MKISLKEKSYIEYHKELKCRIKKAEAHQRALNICALFPTFILDMAANPDQCDNLLSRFFSEAECTPLTESEKSLISLLLTYIKMNSGDALENRRVLFALYFRGIKKMDDEEYNTLFKRLIQTEEEPSEPFDMDFLISVLKTVQANPKDNNAIKNGIITVVAERSIKGTIKGDQAARLMQIMSSLVSPPPQRPVSRQSVGLGYEDASAIPAALPPPQFDPLNSIMMATQAFRATIRTMNAQMVRQVPPKATPVVHPNPAVPAQQPKTISLEMPTIILPSRTMKENPSANIQEKSDEKTSSPSLVSGFSRPLTSDMPTVILPSRAIKQNTPPNIEIESKEKSPAEVLIDPKSQIDDLKKILISKAEAASSDLDYMSTTKSEKSSTSETPIIIDIANSQWKNLLNSLHSEKK